MIKIISKKWYDELQREIASLERERFFAENKHKKHLEKIRTALKPIAKKNCYLTKQEILDIVNKVYEEEL